MIPKRALPNLDSFTNHPDINSLKTQRSRFTDRYHRAMKTPERETRPLLTAVRAAVGTGAGRTLRWLLRPVPDAGSSASTLPGHTFAVFSKPGPSEDCQPPLPATPRSAKTLGESRDEIAPSGLF